MFKYEGCGQIGQLRAIFLAQFHHLQVFVESNFDYYDPKTLPFDFGNQIFITLEIPSYPTRGPFEKHFVAITSICFRGP